MTRANVGRVVLAVIAGWLTNAILVGFTEVLLWKAMRGAGGALPGSYYIIDLIFQCCFTVVAAYLCSLIAGPSRRSAMFGLMLLGLLIGGLFLPSSWSRDPHWYRIALLAVWVPCVGLGSILRSQSAVAKRVSA
jgi:hypothetical protein